MPSYKDKLPIQTTINFDTIPTIGSTNAVTSGGIYNSLILKQDVLTNPVTGTGTAGQVSYWSGTNAVTGSNNLFWDAANNRLGVGTSTPVNTYTQSQLQGVFARYEIRNSNANQNIASWDVYSNTLVSPDFFGRTAFKFEGGINNASRQYQIYVSDTSTPKIVINGSGNVLINSIVDAGQRLQVYGSTLLRGSGTTSATTALLVQNSTPASLLSVTDNGVTTLTPTALTGSEATSALDISQTWNTTGAPTLIKANVTNTASGTNSNLMDLQVGGVSQFAVRRSGLILSNSISFGAGSPSITSVDPTTGFSNQTSAGTSIRLGDGVASNISGYQSYIASPGTTDRQYTSGEGGVMMLGSTLGFGRIFSPTSGTGIFNVLTINYNINQTGGANGITRGLYVNPTLTSAANWRSVEFSNNTGWGLYGAGTAPNYLAGGLGIGASVDTTTSYNLRVSRQFSGGTTGRGIVSDSQITTGPSSVLYFLSAASATATANVANIRHFYATQATFTSGAVVTNQGGFWVSEFFVGATNNFGFRGDIPSGTGRWNLYMNGTAANYLAGDTSIGTTTSSGRLTVRGSGTTSSTTALLVQNSTPTELLKVLDDGAWNFNGDGIVKGSGNTSATTALTVQSSNGTVIMRVRNDGWIIGSLNTNFIRFASTTSNCEIFPQNGSGTFVTGASAGQFFRSSLTSSGTDYFFSNGQGPNNQTSGEQNFINFSRDFTPTSGTATYSLLILNGTINQTGGANGITRGIYVNPTLTAAAAWRSVEFSNNTGWGLYGAGTASNYLAGNTSIGTTTSGGRLTVQGSGTTLATTALQVRNSSGSIITSILDDGRILFGTGVASIRLNANELNFASNASGTAAGNDFTLGSGQGNVGTTSGTFNSILIRAGATQSFNPTSGTGVFNVINISTTINQTGGANGITRGLYINPTLTAAADWRSIETSNNTGYAAYFAGSADLFLGNGTDIQIGTTTGTKIGTATSQKIGFYNATPVVQRTTTSGASTLVGGGGTALTDTDTFDGYTLATVVKALRDLGLLA